MICPTCHQPLPENTAACRACLEAKYLRDLAQTEIQVLPKIIHGELPLTLALESRGKCYHLRFRGGFSNVAYCQTELRSPRLSWPAFEERPRNLCPQCVARLKTFLEQAGITPMQI